MGSKVKDIITNVFSLIEAHGEPYVDRFIKTILTSGNSDEYLVCDYIIHSVRSHYKISQKSFLASYCTGEVRDAKIVAISVIDTLLNVSNPQLITILGLKNTMGLYRLRKQAVNLSDKVKHEKVIQDLITNIALQTKEKFKL